MDYKQGQLGSFSFPSMSQFAVLAAPPGGVPGAGGAASLQPSAQQQQQDGSGARLNGGAGASSSWLFSDRDSAVGSEVPGPPVFDPSMRTPSSSWPRAGETAIGSGGGGGGGDSTSGTPDGGLTWQEAWRSTSSSGSDFPHSGRDYEFKEQLEPGSGATPMWLAKCRTRGNQRVLLRCVGPLPADGSTRVAVMREVAAVASLQHPNVLPLLADFRADFRERDYHWLVYPFQESGSLRSIISYGHEKGISDISTVATLMRDVARGLEYMHRNNFVHGDVSAANVLVSSEGAISLAPAEVQFVRSARGTAAESATEPRALGAALAHYQWPEGPAGSDLRTDPFGSGSGNSSPGSGAAAATAASARPRNVRRVKLEEYRAAMQAKGSSELPEMSRRLGGNFIQKTPSPPQVPRKRPAGNDGSVRGGSAFERGEPTSLAADVRSFGMMMWEVATNMPPAAAAHRSKELRKHEEFQEVVQACTMENPADRPTAKDLLHMRFFEGARDFDEGMVHRLLDGIPAVDRRGDTRPPGELAKIHSGHSTRMDSFRSQPGSDQSDSTSGRGDDAGGADPTAFRPELVATAVDLLQLLAPGRDRLSQHNRCHAFYPSQLHHKKGFAFLEWKQPKWRKFFSKPPAVGVGFAMAKLYTTNGGVQWSAPCCITASGAIKQLKKGGEAAECIFALLGSDVDKLAAGGAATMQSADGSTPCRLLTCRSHSLGLTKLTIGNALISVSVDGNRELYRQPLPPALLLKGRRDVPPAFSPLAKELEAVMGLTHAPSATIEEEASAPGRTILRPSLRGTERSGSSGTIFPLAPPPVGVHQGFGGFPAGSGHRLQLPSAASSASPTMPSFERASAPARSMEMLSPFSGVPPASSGYPPSGAVGAFGGSHSVQGWPDWQATPLQTRSVHVGHTDHPSRMFDSLRVTSDPGGVRQR